MIGSDYVDIAANEFSPKILPLFAVPPRRRTFRDRSKTLDIFIREAEIVRTRFDGNVDPPHLRFRGQRDASPRTDVNDVQLRTGLACKKRGALDCFQLRDHGARQQEITNTETAFAHHAAPE